MKKYCGNCKTHGDHRTWECDDLDDDRGGFVASKKVCSKSSPARKARSAGLKHKANR